MTKLAINGGKPLRSEPFPDWPIFGLEEEKALKRVLRSRKWFSGMLGSDKGSEVASFEKKFADYNDSKYGIAVANGSAALEIALKSIGVGPKDEVIIPAYTFIATATAVIRNNAIPVIVDIQPSTYCIDPDELRAAITDKTGAIVPVHFGGQVAEIDAICEIAEENGIPIVEDACHAIGSTFKGTKAGSFGKAGCFSFQESKTITSGEGGIIVTDDEDTFEKARSYRSCGRDPGENWYRHFRVGWNYRITEFQAAILNVQLNRYPDQIRKRAKNSNYLNTGIKEIPGFSPVTDSPKMGLNCHYYYMVKVNLDYFELDNKQRMVHTLNAEGIPAHEGYPFPITENPLFHSSREENDDFPNSYEYYTHNYEPPNCETPVTKKLANTTIFIPHEVLLGTRSDMDDITAAFKKVSKNLRG